MVLECFSGSSYIQKRSRRHLSLVEPTKSTSKRIVLVELCRMMCFWWVIRSRRYTLAGRKMQFYLNCFIDRWHLQSQLFLFYPGSTNALPKLDAAVWQKRSKCCGHFFSNVRGGLSSPSALDLAPSKKCSTDGPHFGYAVESCSPLPQRNVYRVESFNYWFFCLWFASSNNSAFAAWCSGLAGCTVLRLTLKYLQHHRARRLVVPSRLKICFRFPKRCVLWNDFLRKRCKIKIY